MPLVEIPTAWLLLYPCGKHVDGWYAGVRPSGSIGAATVEQAWDKLARNAEDKRELIAEGWTVRALREGEKVKLDMECDCDQLDIQADE